ncbi:hypothetical protein CR513_05815, partial [Mucuna pruriens]
MRKVLTLPLSEVIMRENLKMKTFKGSVKNKEFFIIFLVQNGVVERKNISLQEMARTILNDFNSPMFFLAEAINTTCYLQNRIYIKPTLKGTPYELWKGIQPNISYFHPFGCECFILNTNPKSDEGKFLGYSIVSKAYKSDKELSELNDSFAYMNLEDLQMSSKEPNLNDDSKENKVETSSRNLTRSTFKGQAQVAVLYKVEPKNIEDALKDEGWIKAMLPMIGNNKYKELQVRSLATPLPCNLESSIRSCSIGNRLYLLEKILRDYLDEEGACQLWRQNLWIRSHQDPGNYLTLQEKLDTSTTSIDISHLLKELKTFHFDDWLVRLIKDDSSKDFRILNVVVYHLRPNEELVVQKRARRSKKSSLSKEENLPLLMQEQCSSLYVPIKRIDRARRLETQKKENKKTYMKTFSHALWTIKRLSDKEYSRFTCNQ